MWIQFIVVNGRITKSPNNIISLIYICISVYSWSLSPNICVARLLIGCFDCFGILPQLSFRIRSANCMAGICFWTSKERSCPNYCPKRLMNENKVLLGCLKPYSVDCYFFITQKRTSFNYVTLTILFRYQEHTFLFKVWQKIQLQLAFQMSGNMSQCITWWSHCSDMLHCSCHKTRIHTYHPSIVNLSVEKSLPVILNSCTAQVAVGLCKRRWSIIRLIIGRVCGVTTGKGKNKGGGKFEITSNFILSIS